MSVHSEMISTLFWTDRRQCVCETMEKVRVLDGCSLVGRHLDPSFKVWIEEFNNKSGKFFGIAFASLNMVGGICVPRY